MEDIKYEYKIGYRRQWNGENYSTWVDDIELKHNECLKAKDYISARKYGWNRDLYFFGVNKTFKPVESSKRIEWDHPYLEKDYIEKRIKEYESKYGSVGNIIYHDYYKFTPTYDETKGNNDGMDFKLSYKSQKNPLINCRDRSKPLEFKTFDELVLEKIKKTKISINTLLEYKKEELENELETINLNISKTNDGIFLWENVISYFVTTNLLGKSINYIDSHNLYNCQNSFLNFTLNKSSSTKKIKLVDENQSKKKKSTVYIDICTYKKSKNEYIFDFGKIPNKYIKNEFCYKINGIIYRSKDYEGY